MFTRVICKWKNVYTRPPTHFLLLLLRVSLNISPFQYGRQKTVLVSRAPTEAWNANIWTYLIWHRKVLPGKKTFEVRWYGLCLYVTHHRCFAQRCLFSWKARPITLVDWPANRCLRSLPLYLGSTVAAAMWWISCVYWYTFQNRKLKHQIPDLEPPDLNS